jgi:hypothetical protein
VKPTAAKAMVKFVAFVEFLGRLYAVYIYTLIASNYHGVSKNVVPYFIIFDTTRYHKLPQTELDTQEMCG